MITHILIFLSIFVLGEILMNYTFFPYLKNYFNFRESDANEENKTSKPFLGLPISIFKGALERFIVYLFLIINLSQILIVFGALKIGTRIDKNEKIKNDYFLIGNFSSLFIAVMYYYLFMKLQAIGI
jgi:hypothetical protein